MKANEGKQTVKQVHKYFRVQQIFWLLKANKNPCWIQYLWPTTNNTFDKSLWPSKQKSLFPARVFYSKYLGKGIWAPETEHRHQLPHA